MKLLLVGGTFNTHGGARSFLVDEMLRGMPDSVLPSFVRLNSVNGGFSSDLPGLVDRAANADAVIWMPKVDNAEPKDARRIKDRFPHILFVTSKENLDGRYELPELVAHGLSLKSNLMIEITKAGTRHLGRVLDPLGNVWEETSYFDRLIKSVVNRLYFLSGLTRVRSVQVSGPLKGVQIDEPFFDLVRRHAEKFHALIQPPPTMTRFLGNATFRCTHGFPAYRVSGSSGTWCLCVSRRNVDKRLAGAEMFVPVEPTLKSDDHLGVAYHGPHKPSVDTPVMVKLFETYPEARYAMHGHVYVKGAPTTNESLPCGCLEEFDAIHDVLWRTHWKDDEHVPYCGPPFVVNLQGHGFLALADDVRFLDELEYVARPAWERGVQE